MGIGKMNPQPWIPFTVFWFIVAPVAGDMGRYGSNSKIPIPSVVVRRQNVAAEISNGRTSACTRLGIVAFVNILPYLPHALASRIMLAPEIENAAINTHASLPETFRL